MESTDMSTMSGIYIIALMFMGYAIGFAYLFIAIARRENKYTRRDYESALKFLEKRVEQDLKWLREDNSELRRELRKLENKSS